MSVAAAKREERCGFGRTLLSMGRKAMRRRRSRTVRRCLLLGALALIGLFYYRPLRSYLSTKHELAQRSAEVHALIVQNRRLQHRLTGSTSGAELVREARQLGWIRPGERLFIVKGIKEWRRKEQRKKPATIGGGG
jgi:hypothetical protein